MDKDHVPHPQGHSLAVSVIISLVALHFLPLKRSAFLGAHLMWSLSFWMHLHEVGMAINFVIPRVMSMGSQGCLLYIRK